MAFIKHITLDSGAAGEYHRIDGFVQAPDGTATAIVGLYVNAEMAKVEGKKALKSSTEHWRVSPITKAGNVREELYVALKALPAYADAVDA